MRPPFLSPPHERSQLGLSFPNELSRHRDQMCDLNLRINRCGIPEYGGRFSHLERQVLLAIPQNVQSNRMHSLDYLSYIQSCGFPTRTPGTVTNSLNKAEFFPACRDQTLPNVTLKTSRMTASQPLPCLPTSLLQNGVQTSERLHKFSRSQRRYFETEKKSMTNEESTLQGLNEGEDTSRSDRMKSDNAMKKKKLKDERFKEPKDMPKKPLSAYNIFSKEEGVEIMKLIHTNQVGMKISKNSIIHRHEIKNSNAVEFQENKSDGKMSIENLAQTIEKRWKALKSNKRQHFQKLADEDMKRFIYETEDYYGSESWKNTERQKSISFKQQEEKMEEKLLESEYWEKCHPATATQKEFYQTIKNVLLHETILKSGQDLSPSALVMGASISQSDFNIKSKRKHKEVHKNHQCYRRSEGKNKESYLSRPLLSSENQEFSSQNSLTLFPRSYLKRLCSRIPS